MKEHSTPFAYSAATGFSPTVTLLLPHRREFLVGSDQQLRQLRESRVEEQLTTCPNPAKDLPSAILFPTDLSCGGCTPVHSGVKPLYRRASFPPYRRYSTPSPQMRRHSMKTHNSSQGIFRQTRKASSFGSPYQQIGKASPVGSPISTDEGDINFEPDAESISLMDETGDNNFKADTENISVVDTASVATVLCKNPAPESGYQIVEPPQLCRKKIKHDGNFFEGYGRLTVVEPEEDMIEGSACCLRLSSIY